MAELAADNIKAKADASNAIGGPTTNIDLKPDLCNAANIDKWSFYRPRPIEVDGSKNVILSSAPAGDRRLGDFRRYNHTSLVPKTANDYTQNWGPGGATMSVTLATFIERLNVKELIPSTTMYFTIDYYLSSANRAAQTSRQRRVTILVSLSTETPPAGHTNNQILAPSSSFQLLTDSGIPTAILTKPDDVLYCDTYISDISSLELIRFDDSYTDVFTHERQDPFVDALGPNRTPVPAGYTFVASAVTDGASNDSGVDFAETLDQTYGLFYWFVYGLRAGTFYRIGSATVTAVLRIPGGTDTEIHNGALKVAASNSNESDSGTLAASQTWAFDDEADVVITSHDWTGFTEFAISGAP